MPFISLILEIFYIQVYYVTLHVNRFFNDWHDVYHYFNVQLFRSQTSFHADDFA